MKKILIASGKGGVGKTTIAIHIAERLAKTGISVGLLDIDIDTPNIPEFLGISDRDLKLTEEGIEPKLINKIEVMSIGFVADTGLAIMWDGSRRAMAIDQMMTHVDWKCDVLVIDSPPGTGEELITIVEKFKPDGIIIVTTNHKASIADVKRTITMINRLNSGDKIIGIIKNMTYIRCYECDNIIDLFESEKDEEIDKYIIAELPYLMLDYQLSIDEYNEQFKPR